MRGSILLLEAAGFVEQKLSVQDGEEEFYVFPADGDIEVLKVTSLVFFLRDFFFFRLECYSDENF